MHTTKQKLHLFLVNKQEKKRDKTTQRINVDVTYNEQDLDNSSITLGYFQSDYIGIHIYEYL